MKSEIQWNLVSPTTLSMSELGGSVSMWCVEEEERRDFNVGFSQWDKDRGRDRRHCCLAAVPTGSPSLWSKYTQAPPNLSSPLACAASYFISLSTIWGGIASIGPKCLHVIDIPKLQPWTMSGEAVSGFATLTSKVNKLKYCPLNASNKTMIFSCFVWGHD